MILAAALAVAVFEPRLIFAAGEAPFAAANHVDGETRARAATGLGRLNTLAAQSVLVQMAGRDPVPEVRLAAVVALSQCGNPVVHGLLETVADHDPDPRVRVAARAGAETLFPLTRQVGTASALAIIPGAGHFYLGRHVQGAAYLTGTVALTGFGLALDGANVGLDGPSPNARAPIGFQLIMAGQNLWMYSIFDAYRDARAMRTDLAYRHPVSDETLDELAVASFRPSVLASPWVWGGVPVLLGAAFGLSALVDRDAVSGGNSLFGRNRVNFLGRSFDAGAGFALGELYWATLFVPVATGEEALFRGAIQPALVERFGPGAGLVAASLLFGAIHFPNFADTDLGLPEKIAATSFIAAAGAYMGLISLRHDGSLARSVAVHFWYDFLLSTAAFIVDPDRQPFVVSVARPF